MKCNYWKVESLKEDHPDKMFFTLANTVATIDFAKKFKGHGWMGIRFQMAPHEPYNEITLHVRFHQPKPDYSKRVLGFMGVNLVYGAFISTKSLKRSCGICMTTSTMMPSKLIPSILMALYLKM